MLEIFATMRVFAFTGLSKVANGLNLLIQLHKVRAQGMAQWQFIP
jgi:hypothetical protein